MAVRTGTRLLVAVVGLLCLAQLPAAAVITGPASRLERHIAEDLFTRINDERQARGLAMLAWDPDQAVLAADWARQMAAAGELTHRDADDVLFRPPWNYRDYVWVGENIHGPAESPYNTAGAVHVSFMASDGHRDTLLSPNLRIGAVGAHCDDFGPLWIAENFGARTFAEFEGFQDPTPATPLARPDEGGVGCDTTGDLPPESQSHDQTHTRPVVGLRVAGPTRIDTAAALAERASSTSRILLARADDPADAVTGAQLVRDGGALVLTWPDHLPEPTRVALERLRIQAMGSGEPIEVLVLGGTAAIPEAIVDEVRALGLPVRRVFGPNRYATAAAAATLDDFAVDEAVVAVDDGFAAALAGANLVAHPPGDEFSIARMLLTPAEFLADDVPAALSQMSTFEGTPPQVTVIGTDLAAVEDRAADLRAEGFDADVLAAGSPVELSQVAIETAVQRGAFTDPFGPAGVLVTGASAWPDALAAGAAVVAGADLLMFADASFTDAQLAWFDRERQLFDLWWIGGTAVVPHALSEQVLGRVDLGIAYQ